MDIYEYLKLDHERISNLFNQFEKNPNVDHKADFVNLIIRDLSVHAESEQKTFYKFLEKFDGSREIAFHGEDEHKEIEELMNTLKKMPLRNKKWENTVQQLKNKVEQHVKEEEGAMFKKAKKILSAEDALIIKEKMHDLKVKLLKSYKTDKV